MDEKFIISDQLIFSPDDVDLSRSPLRKGISAETFVLGAFNPGLCRLPNGNLLLMVRVAEALRNPILDDKVHCIRWDPDEGFLLEGWPLAQVEMGDPRKFKIKSYQFPVYALTSLSWLLPVELSSDGEEVITIHYNKIVSPEVSSQEYGIEDPRISTIDDRYYMTVCCVGSERHSTMLYESDNGLDYTLKGMVLDHQNKDMLLFEGKINNKYYALTRPMGECYFATSPDSEYHPGPYIQLAASPDLLHWKPEDRVFMRARRSTLSDVKIGGGTPPILTPDGWLMLFHGVENSTGVGVYRTFWAILDAKEPGKILCLQDKVPLLESNPKLTISIKDKIYLHEVVFTSGIVTDGDDYLIASGELDLACRLTRISRRYFSETFKK